MLAGDGEGHPVIHGWAPGTTGHVAWTATFAVLTLGGVFAATLQVARFSSSASHTRVGASAVESAAQEPTRVALKAEIDRRWPEIKAWGEALERDHDDLLTEERALDILWYRIESRRRRYPDGFPADAQADDQMNVLNYNQRMTLLRTRIDSYSASLIDYRRAAAEFGSLLQQYDSGNP